MNLKDFDYNLPPELIAQEPVSPKDNSRLLLVDKLSGGVEHKHFYDLPNVLEEGSLLILNNSKVIPARLHAMKNGSGGVLEILLLENISDFVWQVFVKPAKRVKADSVLNILLKDSHEISDVIAELVVKNPDGTLELKFNYDRASLLSKLDSIGQLALPPYIKKTLEKDELYQTCYADKPGSIAAPTAGLHFTDSLFEELNKKNIRMEYVDLHVGAGTFLPVKTDNILKHKMHSEYFEITDEVANRINAYKKEGRTIYVVGTTTCRALESVASEDGLIHSYFGETDIFIYPGYKFKFVENLITNFHLPKSTLLMLVSALSGHANIFNAYKEAVKNKYRFYSFGDAMLIKH